MKILVHFVLGLVPAITWPGMASAGATPTHVLQKQGQATLTVLAELDKGQVLVRLWDVLLVTVSVDGTSQLEVKPASPLSNSEAWKVRSKNPPATLPLEKDRRRWQQTFIFEPLGPGSHSLQLEPWQIRDQPGEWLAVTWKPIPVKVSTQISTADVNDLRDITDIESLPSSPSAWDWALWTVPGVAVLALVLAGAWVWRQRRQRLLPALTPEEWAYRELDRILALNLPAAGAAERFHTMLSNAIRRYLEKRFELPARRQTTPEFLQAMENSPQLSLEQQALLREFLERCDLAKFARARPSVEESQVTAAMARKFVEQTGGTT